MRSSQFGVMPYKVGDLRLLPRTSRPGYFVEDGQEWLRTGMLRSNAGNVYAGLLAKSPGYGINFNVAADRVNAFTTPTAGSTSPTFCRLTMYYTSGGRYVLMPAPNDSGSNIFLRHGPDLSGAGVGVQAAAAALTGHCMHNGLVLISTADNTAGTGVKSFSTSLQSATGMTVQQYGGVASNGTNLAVAIARGTSSNGLNGIQTSVDGVAWTPRTGTSSAAVNLVGIHYSPFLNRFFKWGGATNNSDTVILSTPDGYTDTVAMAATTLYETGAGVGGQVYGGMQHAAASTPGATLLPVRRIADGIYGWLRTTDGVAWSFVSPMLDQNLQGINALPAATVWDLQYDAPRARLVAFAGGSTVTSGDLPAFYTSTDGGLSWQPGCAFGDASSNVVKFLGFSIANGQDLAHVGPGGPNPYLYSYPASKFGPIPSHVGVAALSPAAGLSYHIRIA